MNSIIKITLVKSVIGKSEKHRKIISGLGFKKLNQTISHYDTPEIQGMISKVSHMLNVVK